MGKFFHRPKQVYISGKLLNNFNQSSIEFKFSRTGDIILPRNWLNVLKADPLGTINEALLSLESSKLINQTDKIEKIFSDFFASANRTDTYVRKKRLVFYNL
jgi:hypothetical protein